MSTLNYKHLRYFWMVAKTGSIDITVQTASIGTGDPRLETELRGEKFFDVEKHPTMVFKSKAVHFNGDVPASGAAAAGRVRSPSDVRTTRNAMRVECSCGATAASRRSINSCR